MGETHWMETQIQLQGLQEDLIAARSQRDSAFRVLADLKDQVTEYLDHPTSAAREALQEAVR